MINKEFELIQIACLLGFRRMNSSIAINGKQFILIKSDNSFIGNISGRNVSKLRKHHYVLQICKPFNGLFYVLITKEETFMNLKAQVYSLAISQKLMIVEVNGLYNLVDKYCTIVFSSRDFWGLLGYLERQKGKV